MDAGALQHTFGETFTFESASAKVGMEAVKRLLVDINGNDLMKELGIVSSSRTAPK